MTYNLKINTLLSPLENIFQITTNKDDSINMIESYNKIILNKINKIDTINNSYDNFSNYCSTEMPKNDDICQFDVNDKVTLIATNKKYIVKEIKDDNIIIKNEDNEQSVKCNDLIFTNPVFSRSINTLIKYSIDPNTFFSNAMDDCPKEKITEETDTIDSKFIKSLFSCWTNLPPSVMDIDIMIQNIKEEIIEIDERIDEIELDIIIKTYVINSQGKSTSLITTFLDKAKEPIVINILENTTKLIDGFLDNNITFHNTQ
jgi:hypothetical protein